MIKTHCIWCNYEFYQIKLSELKGWSHLVSGFLLLRPYRSRVREGWMEGIFDTPSSQRGIEWVSEWVKEGRNSPSLTPRPPLVRTAARGKLSAGTLCPRPRLSPVLERKNSSSEYHFSSQSDRPAILLTNNFSEYQVGIRVKSESQTFRFQPEITEADSLIEQKIQISSSVQDFFCNPWKTHLSPVELNEPFAY